MRSATRRWYAAGGFRPPASRLGLFGPVLGRATPEAVVYAVLSLTVVRIVPVAIAMLWTGLARPTLLYVGWFGPRGLASIVFAGVVVEEAVPAAGAITDVVLLTVALSLVAHGITAAWGARRYAAWFERAAAVDPAIPEAAEVPEGGVYSREWPRGGCTWPESWRMMGMFAAAENPPRARGRGRARA